jgi:alcohol dehydrogenase
MLPDYYEFVFPVKIISGHTALNSLPNELRILNVRRPLLMADQGVKAAGLVDIVLNALGESEVTVGALFDQVPPESATDTVNGIADLYRAKHCDGLIAVGGGSVMDTAKGVNILVSKGGDDILAYKGADVLSGPLNPLVVIPTTAGTGSEATNAAVIVDSETHVKLGFVSEYLLPDVAFLDSRMTLTLPPKLTAATAMDALTHAMEAYICIQKNPLSDAFAWKAIQLMGQNLTKALADPGDKATRLLLANASLMAGTAFSNSMVGCVHSLGHAAGAVARIPHGVAMSIFLPHGLRFNLPVRREMIGEMLLPLVGAALYTQTPVSERPEATLKVVEDLKQTLYEKTGLPRNLKEVGVRRDQFEAIAQLAINDGSAMMNPVELGIAEALHLLEKAYA